MDPVLIGICLDDPTNPACIALGQSGAVSRSPSSFVNSMPSGTRPGGILDPEVARGCYGQMLDGTPSCLNRQFILFDETNKQLISSSFLSLSL